MNNRRPLAAEAAAREQPVLVLYRHRAQQPLRCGEYLFRLLYAKTPTRQR